MLSGLIILALVLSLGISAWWLLLSGTTFYVWYLLEWMCKGLWYSIMMEDWTCNMETPYEAVSLEREARIAREDSNYLENSKYFAWLKNI